MSVSAWLPTREYDKLAQQALKEGRSVSALVRDKIVLDSRNPSIGR